ncbi:MAG: hypothetical protein DWQ19_12025 [Crenarchaeota archaeon]|nr:MAG: hypothetical protein DWQ19_12025 [Thermoproteota archaeon]
MKFKIKGVGDINLSQKDFLADGGEGDVYAKGKTAYKIYKDFNKMLPYAKIQELSVLDHPNIIRPREVLFDNKNRAVGYSMSLVDGLPMCQLFTKTFCQRNNIEHEAKVDLVKKFRNLVQFVHQHDGILIVDLNELNFLVNKSFDDLYAIDVNSYQTKSFPATVIMDSIRDRHCNNKFTKETDWFSWGIVTFQLLVGIHPYKGKHPITQGVNRNDWLDKRMEKNISVFNKDSSVPKVCQPFDVIPKSLLAWYKAVFEDGKRIPPPLDFEVSGPIAIVVKKIAGSNLFNIVEINAYPSDILNVFVFNGNRFILTDKTLHSGDKFYSLPSNDVKVTIADKSRRPFAVYLENNQVQVFDVVGQKNIPFTCNASAIVQVNDRIYAQNGINILELMLYEYGSNIQVLSKIAGQALDLPGATKAFDGVIFQNLLGRRHAVLFPEQSKCYQIGIPELDHHKIVDAKYRNNVLVVVGVDHDGKYHRFVMRFSSDYSKYDLRKVENITYTGINFTVNDAGIGTLINEEEKMEAFSNQKDSGTVKMLEDPVVESDMKLYNDGTKILFTRGKTLHSIGMKP